MENPKIGEKFLIIGTVVGVYGDVLVDIANRHATIVLDDGQRIETNLRNLLDPQIVVQQAGTQAVVDAGQLAPAPENPKA